MRGDNQTCGERVASAKLTAAIVREIRRSYRRCDRRYGVSAMARLHDVSRDTIDRVVKLKTWRHVT